MGEATAGIMQKARMARDLYKQQAAIENQVKERCATCTPFVSCTTPSTPFCGDAALLNADEWANLVVLLCLRVHAMLR